MPLHAIFPWPLVNIASLVVPLDRCLSIEEGPVQSGLIERAQEQHFDQLVLRAGTSRAPSLGLISVERLKELLSSGSALRADDPDVTRVELPSCVEPEWYKTVQEWETDVAVATADDGCGEAEATGVAADDDFRLYAMQPKSPIGDILDKFSDETAVLVRPYIEHNVGDGELEREYHDVVGILTLSDLNKHPLRSQLYPVLAEFEDALARTIHHCHNDPWDWMQHINDGAKVGVLGNLRLAERNDMVPDEGPLAFAMLPDLLRVAAQSPQLEQTMGKPFRATCKDHQHDIKGLRNKTMHVVRPLVIGRDDARKVKETLKVVIELTEQLARHDRRRR